EVQFHAAIAASGHGDDARLRKFGLEQIDCLESVLHRHENIGDEQVGGPPTLQRKRLRALVGDPHFEALAFQRGHDESADVLIVVDDEYALAATDVIVCHRRFVAKCTRGRVGARDSYAWPHEAIACSCDRLWMIGQPDPFLPVLQARIILASARWIARRSAIFASTSDFFSSANLRVSTQCSPTE